MHRRTARSATLTLALAAFAPVAALAQQDANIERGFASAKGYQGFEGPDSINEFNGNLVITLPFPIFRVNGGLVYGLTLSYNGKIWNLFSGAEAVDGPLQPYAELNDMDNVGAGWLLSLGELLHPADPRNVSGDLVYIGQDGGEHRFYDTLHIGESASSGKCYTRDGSYLRLNAPGVNCVFGGGALVAEVEFPGGQVQKFTWDSGSSRFRLGEIRDRFGNTVTVTYFTNPTRWQITDGHRTHSVEFTTKAGREVVERVKLAAFGGATAEYTFGYAEPFIQEHCGDDSTTTPATRQVALLTSVTLPAGGGSYLMDGVGDYYTTCQDEEGETIDDLPGVLHRLRLPTRGTVEWAYDRRIYLQRGISGSGEPTLEVTETLGVESRKLFDAAGTPAGTWTYTASQPGQTPGDERWVRVTYPTGDETVLHFSTPQLPSNATWTGWEYGLPFKKSATSGAGYFLSQEIYEGSATSGVKRRSTYLGYEHDKLPLSPDVHRDWYATNRRVVRHKTIYHDDGNREATVVYSQADGLGHYRRRDLGGTFDSGNTRTDTTDFNPSQGIYFVNPSTNVQSGGYTPWPASSPWVVDTFTSHQTTEGGQTAREEYHFQASTGYLLRRRVLKAGTTQGANDVVFVFTRDGTGNTIREQRYGSDTGSVGSGTLSSISLGTEQSRMDHTYQSGSLATSRFYQAGGSPMGFFVLDRTINANTGLPSSARDPALVTTTFAYDALGRPTSEETGGDAKTTYTWILGQGTGFANVKIKKIQDGGSAVLAEGQLVFDHFGRPMIEKQKLASGAFSKRRTFYNAMGWVTDVAEWEPDSGNQTAFTRYRDFDPFGRPRRIEPPDGAAHDVDLSYFGAREVQRTVKVATGANGVETSATATERYDRQGRLVQVVEPAGVGGANVTTAYGYDEGGRLVSVSMGGTQSRSFTYDDRGFPTSECHPEKGAAGNGCVTYALYDAWGRPGRVTDGPNDLRWFYDRAGRPTLVRENAGQQRTLKQWTYGTGTGAADRSNGKVKTADRYNYVFLGATPYTVLVRETYTYGGRSGRVSTRATDSTINPQGGPPTDGFTQSFVWNDLGDPASLVYPSRTSLPVGRTVSFGYTNGILTSVPGYASSITYHPNGMPDRITHTNSVTDFWGQDPNKMQRPAAIDAWYAVGTLSASPRFFSGAYGYDGSGNVETLGNAYFVYDKVSRLVDSRLYLGSGGGGSQVQQSYSFDAFGNLQSITTNGVTRNTPTSSTTNRLTSGSYDAAGNLTGYTGALYEYGAFNDIWHYKNGAEEAIYLYTAGGERLWEFNLNGKNRWTLRDLGGKVLREYSYDRGAQLWTVERDYIYRDGALLAAETPQGIRHFTVDHLGTPRLITNAFGNQVAYHLYYPFGEEATAFNQDSERMKFTGHERDLNSLLGAGDDLDYMHARFHSPLTARFLSADLIGGNPWLGQSWNRYTYVLGNPVNFIDPYGLDERGSGNVYVADPQGSFGETITVVGNRWPGTTSFPTRRGGGGGSNVTPWTLGWEWLTGRGERNRFFFDDEPLTELLKKHEHIQGVLDQVCSGAVPPFGTSPHDLSGIKGVPKYLRDYSTLSTGGLTGNLAVTYLGSYRLDYSLEGSTVSMTAYNESKAASALRPPVLGYTRAWNNTAGRALDSLFSSGPMSTTTQTFNMTLHCP